MVLSFSLAAAAANPDSVVPGVGVVGAVQRYLHMSKEGEVFPAELDHTVAEIGWEYLIAVEQIVLGSWIVQPNPAAVVQLHPVGLAYSQPGVMTQV